jgi:hypothetical protein
MYIGLHVKYPLVLLIFNQTWIFFTDFRNILKYQTSCISVQWEPSCSMRTYRHDEAFWNFLKEHKSAFIPTIATWTLTTKSAKFGLIYNLAILISNSYFVWPASTLVTILTELPRFLSLNIFSQNFPMLFLSYNCVSISNVFQVLINDLICHLNLQNCYTKVSKYPAVFKWCPISRCSERFVYN